MSYPFMNFIVCVYVCMCIYIYMYVCVCICVCVYIYIYIYIYIYCPDIGMMVRLFAIGSKDQGSIAGRVMPKTPKMVLDASLLNTQHYTVWIKGCGAIQRKESCSFLHLGVVAIEESLQAALN